MGCGNSKSKAEFEAKAVEKESATLDLEGAKKILKEKEGVEDVVPFDTTTTVQDWYTAKTSDGEKLLVRISEISDVALTEAKDLANVIDFMNYMGDEHMGQVHLKDGHIIAQNMLISVYKQKQHKLLDLENQDTWIEAGLNLAKFQARAREARIHYSSQSEDLNRKVADLSKTELFGHLQTYFEEKYDLPEDDQLILCPQFQNMFAFVETHGQGKTLHQVQWSEVKKGWFMLDAGALVHDWCYHIQSVKTDLDTQQLLDLQKTFCDRVCEGYKQLNQDTLGRELLAIAVNFRRNLVRAQIKIMSMHLPKTHPAYDFMKKYESDFKGDFNLKRCYDICGAEMTEVTESMKDKKGEQQNQEYDDNVKKILGDNQLVVKKMKCLKRSYNNVFYVELEDETKLIVKSRGVKDAAHKVELDKFENNLAKFVKYAATFCPVSTYYGPGVITTDTLQLSISCFVEGREATDEDRRTKEFVVSCGKWLREFHVASADYKQKFPESYNSFVDARDHPSVSALYKASKWPDVKEEDFIIVHQDLHAGNFLVNEKNNLEIIMFDMDLLARQHPLMDLGGFISNLANVLVVNEADVEAKRNLAEWMIEGYTNGQPEQVDKALLREFIQIRTNFSKFAFNYFITTDQIPELYTEDWIKKWQEEEAKGKLDFYEELQLQK